MKMIKNPIRRAQLIAPFGVGALVVIKDGTSLISAGLDHWYKSEMMDTSPYALKHEEFRITEWRLQRLLNVDHFRLPPDYRDGDLKVPNSRLHIPFLRFPQWHFCPNCRALSYRPLTDRQKIVCDFCTKDAKKRYVHQVPLVAICEEGHIQDFPWREWVHASSTPICTKKIQLIATGGASLSAQIVKCECGKKRSLGGVTTGNVLSSNLDSTGEYYKCQGKKPWLGIDQTTPTPPCECILRASLRSASNMYYADVKSAIYLPTRNDLLPPELLELLEHDFDIQDRLRNNPHLQPENLRARKYAYSLDIYSDEQIQKAITHFASLETIATPELQIPIDLAKQEEMFRREEFEVLCKARKDELLVIEEKSVKDYSFSLETYFSRINIISKLRETRVLAGFTRIFPGNKLSFEQRRELLRLNIPREEDLWLPAYVVNGEGIFLEFREDFLQKWERINDVRLRAQPLVGQYKQLIQTKRTPSKDIGARYILLHTFAHLFINRLTFECGYGVAALRERLYVSSTENAEMAGILIYTAAGDSEGTMGGLVRMGLPGKLEPVIQRALTDALWCSADPVCMETEIRGFNLYNLAACHNCALISETSCEDFNHFLDRALVVGKIDHRELGYFQIQ